MVQTKTLEATMLSAYVTTYIAIFASVIAAPAPPSIRIMLREHAEMANAIAYSPNGKLIATGDGFLYKPGKIHIWDAKTGILKSKLDDNSKSITCLTFSSDGNRLVSGGYDGRIVCWDIYKELVLYSIQNDGGPINSISISPNAALLAVASRNQVIKVYNFRTGKLSFTLSGHKSSVEAIAFSPDGKTLASGGYMTVKLWDIPGEKLITSLSHQVAVTSLVFSHNGDTLISGGFGDFSSVSINNFSWTAFISASKQPSEITIWDFKTQKIKKTINILNGALRTLDVSPDGKFLAFGTADISLAISSQGELKLWDFESEQFFLLSPLRNGEDVQCVRFSPNGTWISIAGSRGIVHVVNVNRALTVAK